MKPAPARTAVVVAAAALAVDVAAAAAAVVPVGTSDQLRWLQVTLNVSSQGSLPDGAHDVAPM